MELVYLILILFFCVLDTKRYKTFLTPITVLFFPVVILIFINNYFSPWDYYKIDKLSIRLIFFTMIIFLCSSIYFKLNRRYIIKIKKEKKRWIEIVCTLTFIMLVFRFLFDIYTLGGLSNFEMLKLNRKNTFFSNFVEFFSIFIPILLICKKRNQKIIYILFIFIQLLFQNKNRVFILILQTLFLADIFFKVKIKRIFKYFSYIIVIFFLIYNLKGFSQVGLALDLKNHNLQIIERLYLYLVSPLINIKSFYEKSIVEGSITYIFVPVIGILNKILVLNIEEPNILYFPYIINKRGYVSNVGSIFGEVVLVNNLVVYTLFFIFLSGSSYYIFNRRKKNIYYAIFSSFILATLSLSFFSNIFNLLFIWKRIFLILIIILMKKIFNNVYKY